MWTLYRCGLYYEVGKPPDYHSNGFLTKAEGCFKQAINLKEIKCPIFPMKLKIQYGGYSQKMFVRCPSSQKVHFRAPWFLMRPLLIHVFYKQFKFPQKLASPYLTKKCLKCQLGRVLSFDLGVSFSIFSLTYVFQNRTFSCSCCSLKCC